MIYIEDSQLKDRAANSDKAFHANIKNTGIEAVFLNGERIFDALYVDIEKGFLIKIKSDVAGKTLVVNGEIGHEVLFGDVTVKYR